MELLQTFEYENIKVETYYKGLHLLPNKVYINGVCILEDESFRPSPLNNIDDTETMVSLLGFYMVQPGEVDDEYFKFLNCPELLKWSNNSDNAESVRLMLFDFENANDNDYLKSHGMSKKYAHRIKKYIVNH